MDKPAEIIYKKKQDLFLKTLRILLLIISVGLAFYALYLRITVGDSIEIELMLAFAGILFCCFFLIIIPPTVERYQIKQLFNNRWGEWQLEDKKVWFGKNGIYDEKVGFIALDELKSVKLAHDTIKDQIPKTGISFSCGGKGSTRYGSYDTSARYVYDAPEGREAEAQALVERYTQQYHLDSRWSNWWHGRKTER